MFFTHETHFVLFLFKVLCVRFLFFVNYSRFQLSIFKKPEHFKKVHHGHDTTSCLPSLRVETFTVTSISSSLTLRFSARETQVLTLTFTLPSLLLLLVLLLGDSCFCWHVPLKRDLNEEFVIVEKENQGFILAVFSRD